MPGIGVGQFVGSPGRSSAPAPPALVGDPTIDASGLFITLPTNTSVTYGGTGATLHGTSAQIDTYESGGGTTAIVFRLDQTAYQGETITADFDAGFLLNSASVGSAVITGQAVTNGSTVGPSFTAYIPGTDATFTPPGTVGAGWDGSVTPAYGGFEAYKACDGTGFATWPATGLTAGTVYDFAVTWSPEANRGSAVAFAVLDSNGSTVLSTVNINEQNAPDSFTAAGAAWKTIASGILITGTTATVKLTVPNEPGQYALGCAARVSNQPP